MKNGFTAKEAHKIAEDVNKVKEIKIKNERQKIIDSNVFEMMVAEIDSNIMNAALKAEFTYLEYVTHIGAFLSRHLNPFPLVSFINAIIYFYQLRGFLVVEDTDLRTGYNKILFDWSCREV